MVGKNRSYIIIVVFILLLILIIAAAPASAASFNITAVTGLVGNCSSQMGVLTDFSLAGTSQDYFNGNWRDAVALVLYDGNGTAFAYIGIWISFGFSNSYNGAGWNYPFSSLPATRPFTLKVYDNTVQVATGMGQLAQAQTGPVLSSITFDPAAHGLCSNLPLAGSSETPTNVLLPVFFDGRINNYDAAAPIAVYGIDRNGGRGLNVYQIDGNGIGHEALLVEPEQVTAVQECPPENTLIASNEALGIFVYRLASCEFQVNAPTHVGKTYTMIFTNFYPDTGYHSFEE